MPNYKLVEQDYEWLDKIIQTTTSIAALYQKLFILEVNGGKDTLEYTKLLDYLNVALEVEEQAYRNANLDNDKSNTLMQYILDNKVPDGFINDFESIIEADYSNMVFKRILNNLAYNVAFDYERIKKSLPKHLIASMKRLGIPNPQQYVFQAVYSGTELKRAFEKDILNGFLVFLQECTHKSVYQSFRKDLIYVKYNMSFVYKFLENDLVNSKFVIPEVFTASSILVRDITQTDDDFYISLKDDYGTKAAINQISALIQVSDVDYDDVNDVFTSILRECMLRSSFLFMSDEALLSINEKFHDFIESSEYLQRYPDNQISEDKIILCFRGIKRDRNKLGLSSGDRKK